MRKCWDCETLPISIELRNYFVGNIYGLPLAVEICWECVLERQDNDDFWCVDEFLDPADEV